MSPDQVATTLTVLKALTEELAGIEDYHYTRMINAVSSKQEKLEILSCLFGVAVADHSVNAEEDQRIGIIAENLQLYRKDFIEVRSQFREFLDVLKNCPG